MLFLRSLQWRLVFIFISIPIVLMIVVSVYLNRNVEASYYPIFTKSIVPGLETLSLGKSPTLDEIYAKTRDNKEVVVYMFSLGDYKSYSIIDRKNPKILYSTDKRFNLGKESQVVFTNQIFKSPNLITALNGKVGDQAVLTYYGNDAFFDYAQPYDGYILYFRYDREEWVGTLDSFNRIILLSLVFALAAAVVLGYLLSKTITVPVVNIMHKAREIAAGSFDRLLDVKSQDEIGELTNTFNYMAGELKETLTEIASEKNKIETILNYMTDGVMAFNLKGEVIHANPASKKILEGFDETDKNFEDFWGQFGLEISINELLYFGSTSNVEKNIEYRNKFVRAYFALFTDEEEKAEGIIVVLQDNTQQQKLENMRKEFVANVSHELRTPLTSIKSYSETLLDGALEDRSTTEKFLGVINSEADRMTRLVKDLLQLTRLDNRQMGWDFGELSLVDLVRNCVENMQIEAKNKEHTMECFVIGNIPGIMADKDRMEQVVLNLISNAIKYTQPGGKIMVYVGKRYADVYVKVTDTGIGIPKEDLPRIFERFYRVDKARSREMGGTGLGLAIAKEIVEVHGGTISVTSERGKGSEFIVRLPFKTDTGLQANTSENVMNI